MVTQKIFILHIFSHLDHEEAREGRDMSKRPQIVGMAEFTIDMAQTLNQFFEAYATDGVVSIEILDDRRLFLRNPLGGRQFLGLARFTEEEKREHQRKLL